MNTYLSVIYSYETNWIIHYIWPHISLNDWNIGNKSPVRFMTTVKANPNPSLVMTYCY